MSQSKLLKISYQQAMEACGDDSVVDTLNTLLDEGSILSYNVMIDIEMDRDKAAAIENLFLLRIYSTEEGPKRKKRTE